MLNVQTNVASMAVTRALNMNTLNMSRSVERLSSGYRLNKAGDDAAGQSIVDGLTAEVEGIGKARQNALDGISMTQMMDGALGIIQDNVLRIRELMVQGLNGTNGVDELDALQREINERITIIDDIADVTTFNGIELLKTTTADVTLQTGANTGETSTLTLTGATGFEIDITATTAGSMNAGAIAIDTIKLDGSSVASQDGSVTGTTGSAGTLAHLDTILGNVNRMRSTAGAFQNSLESKLEYLAIAEENVASSRSRIRDLDVAKESSNLVKNQILQQASASMLAQANATPNIALSLIP